MITLLPVPPKPSAAIVLPALIERAARAYGIQPADLRSERRAKALARARWAVMWAARVGTPYSYPRVGRALRRDHTTVMHGVREAVKLREQDPMFRALCDELLTSLEDVGE